MAKSQSVEEIRRADALERTKRRGRPKTNQKSRKVKAPKRQIAQEASRRTRARTKSSVERRTKQQICLDLLNRPQGANVKELQATTGWKQHSVRGFLAGAVKKKLGLALVSEKPDASPRRYRISDTV